MKNLTPPKRENTSMPLLTPLLGGVGSGFIPYFLNLKSRILTSEV
ncbi:MAG: hypothetical protein ACI83W_000941 [Marinoscillum sp.]|jgi:hypothetical protein